MPEQDHIKIFGEPPSSLPEMSWIEMMDVAFNQACEAAREDEVPVGAALFSSTGELIATGRNRPLASNDPTAHAEIDCLRNACLKIENYRVPKGSILAVTLEPCLMCLGAIIHARVSGVVFGATDLKTGALVSNINPNDLLFLNHRVWSIGGVLEEKCRVILQNFFFQKRQAKSN